LRRTAFSPPTIKIVRSPESHPSLAWADAVQGWGRSETAGLLGVGDGFKSSR